MPMSHDRALIQIFNTKPEGVRSVGRPKLRWEDGVNQDIKKHQVSTSGRIPLSRETNGLSLLRRPWPTRGCRANDDDDDDDVLHCYVHTVRSFFGLNWDSTCLRTS